MIAVVPFSKRSWFIYTTPLEANLVIKIVCGW
jgi:hypothetical protein